MEQKHRIDHMSEDIKEYVNLKTDLFKLQAVESLAMLFSRGTGFVIMVLLLGIGVVMFTCAITILMASLLGSLLWALVVMGFLFCIIGAAVYVNHERLFADSMVSMFSKMMFRARQNNDKDGDKDE